MNVPIIFYLSVVAYMNEIYNSTLYDLSQRQAVSSTKSVMTPLQFNFLVHLQAPQPVPLNPVVSPMLLKDDIDVRFPPRLKRN